MDLEELKTTDLWNLYEQGRNYLRMMNVYSDTDLNYRMYNGDQWNGLNIQGIEPVQENFIKSIVKFKVGTINSNLWQIVFTSENFENPDFRKEASKVCELLNKYASKIWEKDNMDLKIRQISKDSAINDEAPMYIDYSIDEQLPHNEILSKNDIHYGNENDSNIQEQPYIIIKQRKPVITVRQIAENSGVSQEKILHIFGDNDTFEEAGDDAKYEKDDMCTILTKLYKENGTVHFEQATKHCVIKKDKDSGLTYYPVAHMLWEERQGSARGEGEVRHLIPNQIEVNKILMRSALVVKQTAYPTKVVNTDKVQNPDALETLGGIIKTKNSATVDDVNKIFSVVNPAQMSADVEKLRNELISMSRELAGAGDIATGSVNPESASGKAILAVQQASQQPLVEQLASLKAFIEDVARIWLDLMITYSVDGINLEETVTDPETGEEYTQLYPVSQETLKALQASVKVEITPKGAFDKYAQELSIENIFKAGFFAPEKLGELKTYLNALDDDANMPKQKLLEAIEKAEEEQQKIAMIEAQAQMMQQRASQFLDSNVDIQASQMSEAQMQAQVNAERQAMAQEREGMAEEREEVAEEEEE